MFNGHPQALINLNLCAMTIVNRPVIIFWFFWILTAYLNFKFKF